MTETTRRRLERRSQAHSDVADTPPFRQRLEELTETEFGRALIAETRAARGSLVIRNLNAEWLKSDEGLIYEMSADVEEAAE